MQGQDAARGARLVAATLAFGVLAATGAGSAQAAARAAPRRAGGIVVGPAGKAFYDPPARLPAGRAGTVIWARPIEAPKGARAWKVLYKSTVVGGRVVPVSGLVIAPAGKAPRRGRPVVAWAHGTLGGARSCAPSIPGNPARDLSDYYTYTSAYSIDVGVPALTRMLRAGYVVTATDYQGLGTPGVHQYTVGPTEAANVLDSVTAARGLGTAVGAGSNDRAAGLVAGRRRGDLRRADGGRGGAEGAERARRRGVGAGRQHGARHRGPGAARADLVAVAVGHDGAGAEPRTAASRRRTPS